MAAHTGPGITGNTQSVTTSAAAVVDATNFHRTVVVQNIDATNPVYVGGHNTAALTASNGYRIAAGESFSVDLPPFAELYAISGGTVEIRYLVLDGRSSW